MSSFPQHEDNLRKLKALGFNVDEFSDDAYESWDYDSLVYLIESIIEQLERKDK